ncbi:MAG: ferrous iron transport protein A [Gemmatimonadetes bacterium]|nr:ferrous iron transport protein A [Gemmatimonadota bacterium]
MGCTLDQLAAGERAVIDSVDCPPVIARRLMELGVLPGTEVEVIRRAPLGDPMEIALRGVHLSLRKSEARHIDVTPS